MSRRIVLVQHGKERPDNCVSVHLAAHGYRSDIRRPCNGDPLPGPDEDVAGCVVFGGLYNVYDTDLHPFLRDEYRFIGRCLDAGIPLLGICQGAQMIAWHLGAHVGPPKSNVHEFGYYELTPTGEAGDFLPSSIHVVQSHWHGFDLPAGATKLAASALFPNQAFRIGDRVFGFQFHAEVTPEGFRGMQERGGARYGLSGVQPRAEQDRLMALHDGAQGVWFNGFLQKLFPANPRNG